MFSEILKSLRTKKNISQRQLAKTLFVSQQTIAKWEINGSTPNPEMLHKIADVFDVSVDYLIGYNKAKNLKTQIPVLGSIPAGVPLEAIEDIQGWEDLSLDAISSGKEYFALKIKGESMSPKYLEGDVVIFEISSTCESGKDCAVFVNGDDATFKKVIKKEAGIALQPLNPAYDVLFFSNYEINTLPITIIGMAVEIRRSV